MSVRCSVFCAVSLDGFLARKDGAIDWLKPAESNLPPADTGFALAAMILVTEIGFLQRIFSMVDLTLAQWGICLGIALSLIVVEELIKFFVRRRRLTVDPVDPGARAVA